MEIILKNAKIEFANNGPARLSGDIEIHNENGDLEKKEKVSLCRCGESLKMPYCDGTHKKVGFEG